MTHLDWCRKAALIGSLTLLTIPGFSGFELSMLGIRLGRLQAFKFVFVAWMIFQGIWLLKQKTPPVPRLRRRALLLWGGILFLDLFLFIGLKFEGGQGRGWSIYLALIIGQVAAVLTVLDQSFPVQSMLKGLKLATLVLVLFSILERAFPNSAVMQGFLALVRDSKAVSFQLGSSLSTVALAEFVARVLPLVLLFSFTSVTMGLVSLSLLIMGMLTLEKSAALSIFVTLVMLFSLGYGRSYFKYFAAAASAGLLAILLLQGPEQVMGRYFGMFLSSKTSHYNVDSKQSVSERKEFWKQAIIIIRAKPLTGIGLDGFSYRYQNRIAPVRDAVFPEASHAHNLFLELGVSGGIGAFLAALMIFGAFALSGTARPVALLYAASLLVSMMVDARIYVSWFAITLFWFGGMAWVIRRDQVKGAAS